MSNYRPGTLDDSDALKRRLGEIDRTAREANKPTGSNAYGTTAKMQFLDEGFGQYAIPVHGIVWMTTDTPPSEAGYVGPMAPYRADLPCHDRLPEQAIPV